PEMRWRPQEHDQKQNEWLKRDLATRRHPADHRRERTSSAADHDVLRCASLEPNRINDNVEEDRKGEQRRSLEIGCESKNSDGAASKDNAECQRLRARDRPAGNRTPS